MDVTLISVLKKIILLYIYIYICVLYLFNNGPEPNCICARETVQFYYFVAARIIYDLHDNSTSFSCVFLIDMCLYEQKGLFIPQ